MEKGLSTEIERFRVRGLRIEDLLNPNFVKSMKTNGLEFIPFILSIDLTSEKEIITINHNSPKEAREGIAHLDGRTQETLEKFTKILKDVSRG